MRAKKMRTVCLLDKIKEFGTGGNSLGIRSSPIVAVGL